MADINILFPVYNEENRLKKGIEKTISFFKKYELALLSNEAEKTYGSNKDTEVDESTEANEALDYELTIIDNASTDKTKEIANVLCEKYKQVHYIGLNQKGVGVAFRAGIENNKSPIVGYMDVDLSTDIEHIVDVVDLFKTKIDIVNASRYNKKSKTKGRKWYRNLTSQSLTLLLKLTLKLRATDSICGFKFFRKEVAEQLVSQSKKTNYLENGWFYIIELLLRAERAGFNIYELPVRWEDDSKHSTVNVWKLILNYCQQIIRLRKTFKSEGIL